MCGPEHRRIAVDEIIVAKDGTLATTASRVQPSGSYLKVPLWQFKQVMLAVCCGFLCLAGLVILWLGFEPAAAADVGPTGEFQTPVAIKVPSFHGLEPQLGLVYSSSESSSWMGRGWSLQGISTLRRQSMKHGLPQWDASDTFALDGRDLIACPASDTGGSAARSPSCLHRLPGMSAYTTRVESLQRIAAEGDPLQGSNGGARWIVWRTDGVNATYEPGLVTSRGVLEWRLAKVEDLSGNAVSYDWAPFQGLQASKHLYLPIRSGNIPHARREVNHG